MSKAFVRLTVLMLTLAVSSTWAGQVSAAKHAVIIGVGRYPNLTNSDLRAPGTDVVLMSDAAIRMGVPRGSITVLATDISASKDGIRSSGQPTRTAILASLENLANRVRSGDQALIYISSHGTQQPDQPVGKPGHDEADGYDEVILPTDASRWDQTTGTVTNGILDEELGSIVDRIRAVGASVWMIVDACHSGTALRGNGPRGRNIQYKKVDQAALGIPSATRPVVASLSASTDYSRSNVGGLVAFYAVAPSELAPSAEWLMDDGNYSSKSTSLLTFAIHNALEAGNVTSYRDLAQRVRGTYAYQSVGVTPQFEGEFNRPVLGDGLVAPKSWVVDVTERGLLLRAGQLDFIEKGAILKVKNLRDPSNTATYEVSAATPTSATLVPVRGAASLPTLDDKDGRFRADLLTSGVGLEVRISPPADQSGLNGLAARAVEEFVINPAHGASATKSGESTDIIVRAGADRVWLASGDTRLTDFDPSNRRQPPYVLCPDRGQQCTIDVNSALQRLVRARRISKLLSAAGEGVGNRMRVQTFVRRARGPEGQSSCAPFAPLSTQERYAPLSADPLPKISDCDQLWVSVTYTGTQALDVTPIYVAIDGSIVILDGDTRRDEDLRILPGETRQFFVRIRTSKTASDRYPVGRENAMVIAIEQPASAPPRTYRWLATPKQAALRASGSSDPLTLALARAEAPNGLRDAAAFGESASAVVQIPLDVEPR